VPNFFQGLEEKTCSLQLAFESNAPGLYVQITWGDLALRADSMTLVAVLCNIIACTEKGGKQKIWKIKWTGRRSGREYPTKKHCIRH